MIALDTNVLLRYVLADDARQHARARRVIEDASDRGERCLVSDLVLAEVVWVLESTYRVDRLGVLAVLESLRSIRSLQFESDARFERALDALRFGRGDFADYLIREQARDRGCSAVMTFDRALLEDPGFTAP